MKTSHIRNVVLYAKNFYMHTSDVVKDMQRFMQLDGHKYKTIDTPEKVVKVMRADYVEYLNSLPPCLEKEHAMKDIDGKVSWADGPAASIHYWLIHYQIYIPMSSKYLGYPTYDRYHLPQQGTFDVNHVHDYVINCSKDFKVMLEKAKSILDITQEEEYDAYMNSVLDNIDFENTIEFLKQMGEVVSEKDLENEIWDDYCAFIEEVLQPDHTLKLGYYTRITKHFAIKYDNNAEERVNIEIGLKVYHQIYSISKNSSTDELWKQFFDDKENNTKCADIISIFNSIFTDNQFGMDNYNDLINNHIEAKEDMKRFNGKYLGYGGFTYEISEIENDITLSVLADNWIIMKIKERRLWN